MRGWITAAVAALALAGCGGTSGDAGDDATRTAAPQRHSRPLVEKCTERLLARVPEAEREEAQHYVEVTYCSRFVERGWVYDDGALSVDAHKWLEAGAEEECAIATKPGEPARRVPCEEFGESEPYFIADCALLEQVRASEVREYTAELRRRYGDVKCEDGTPLAELGTP